MEFSRTRSGMKIRPVMNEFVSVQHYESIFSHVARMKNYEGYWHKKTAFEINPKWHRAFTGRNG